MFPPHKDVTVTFSPFGFRTTKLAPEARLTNISQAVFLAGNRNIQRTYLYGKLSSIILPLKVSRGKICFLFFKTVAVLRRLRGTWYN
ncbi:hypothetical protein TREVI0001_0499 [Treponema vincentii ATCC 35580]|uniref:Uncharacterized protein n=1 Tax=Treponema vincentii ATCC 35580 TaxID=596324 RepID=C8PM87_9SPIR|nr:hypothetical protein TREVI0001_0499 [Treponema vincentii ATCC 35580]